MIARIGTGRLVAIALMLVLVGFQRWDPPVLETVRLKTFDFYQIWKPREIKPAPVRIIDIDDESLAYLGQWPWPRSTVADMLAAIKRLGGVAVGFDIVFAEEDRLSPDRVARTLPNLSKEASDELIAMPKTDEVFAGVVSQTRTVLGQSGTNNRPRDPNYAVPQQTPVAVIGPDPKPNLVRFPALLQNIPELESAAMGRGLFSIKPDIDGIVRRVPLVMAIDDTIQPALSMELLRVATGQQAFAVKSDDAGVKSVVIGTTEVPTDRNGRMWVYFTEHSPDRFVSAQSLIRGEAPADKIAGHLVLVGTSSVGLLDIRATPIDPAMPGVEIHAQLLESVLTGEHLTRPNFAIGAEVILGLVISTLIIILVPILGALPVLLLGVVIAASVMGGSIYLFTEKRILIDAAYPLSTSFLVFGTLVFLNYRREEVQRKEVRSAFGQYLSPALVEQLAEDPSKLTLGGETRTLSVLFSDVRGFTAISESYKEDPQGLTRLMNQFLTPLSNAIMDRGGTIDKYMGDAIMAFWNAPLDDPDHAKHACDAALAMLRDVDRLNVEREREAEAAGVPFLPLNVGVGINTGDCVVGNMGSDQRFDYSVLGDSVNLASRLEGQSKGYGLPIIVGDATADAARDGFAIIEIDLIRVKGKQEPEHVHAVLGDHAVRESEWFGRVAEANKALLASYRGRAFESAKEALEALRRADEDGTLTDYLALYAERIEVFEADPPPEDWDGVFVATSK
ncbi:MAG: adenylate/guanylate cyclase domain-containing protein [Pseudomonadota bacterium]